MAATFDIVSFGDVTTLNTVFNAVAAITQDSSYKAGAAALALFVFVLSMMGTLSEGKQELPIARLFASFMLYMVGFSYVSTISLENRYDSTVSTVDNIPIGVAVPASLISNIGLNLAELAETAFGNVNEHERITERGYLSPLKTLVEFRNVAFKSCPAGEQNSITSGYKFCSSYRNYVRDCVKPKAMRDAESANMREHDFLTAIKFNSEAFATLLVKSDGSVEELSCKDAYAKIETMFNSSDFELMTNVLGERVGVKVATETVFDLTSDILDSIKADSGKANNLLKTIMAFKLTEEGEYSYYYKNNASDYAENLNSSITQRNYSWTMQGEIFIQIVNKLLTILECILYAITPFIALMALCGSLGSKSFLLYMQMLAIIQLIPLLLVVSQNIVMNNMEREVYAISAQYTTGSIEWMLAVFDAAQEQIALGGWIAAVVVPAMAMSLVTGTGMAMMGALKGAAAQPKDTDATPEITKQGGATESIESLNLGTRDSYGNVMTSNYKDRLGKAALSFAKTSLVSDAQTRMKQAQNNYNEALENVFTKQDGSTYTSGELISYGNSINSNKGTLSNFVQESARSHSGYADMSATEQNQLSGLLAAGLTFGVGKNNPITKLLGLSLNAGGKLQEQYTDGVSQSVRDAYTELTSGKKGETLQAQYQETKQAAMQKNENVQSNNSELDSKAERISKARQEVSASTQQYQEAKSASETASFMASDMGMTLARMAQDDKTWGTFLKLLDQKREDPNWMRQYTHNLNEAEGGVNGTDLQEREAQLASFIHTNNEFRTLGGTQKLLSTYSQGQTSNELLQNGGLVPSVQESEVPKFGALDEKPVAPPTRGTVPTKLDPAKFDGYKSDVQNDFEANKARVQKEAEDFKNSDEMKPYVNKYNELKNKVDFVNKEVVPIENARNVLDKSIDMSVEQLEATGKALSELATFSPEEAFNSVKNIVMQSFEQPAVQDFKQGLTNGYEAAKEIYNTARAAYYDSPIGQAEIKSLDFLEKQFNALEQTLSKGGSEAYQGFNSFLDDVSTELTKLLVEPSQGVYQGTNPQKPEDGGTGSTILSDIASGMAQADYMSNEEFLVEHGAELDDFAYSSDIGRDEEKQAIFDTVKGRGYTDEEATLAANTIDKVREYEDIKSQLELTDEDNPRRESAEKYLELLDQQIQSVNSEFGGGLFTNYSNDDANQPVMAAGNAAGESNTGSQTQSPEQPINTQAQVAEPNADAPEATQPVMAAATTAGNAAGEPSTGAQAQGNAEAINTQGQVAEPSADAPEATQPVMAAATTAGNAAGESNTGAQSQGNAEAINTQGQVAEPNADAPEATQPVMAAATTAGNAAGESNTGAQAQGNAEAINTQGQVAEPNADAPEATQPVMAAATTAGNAAGEPSTGAQAQGNAEAINTQGQVAEPNADAPEATQPVMAAATTAGNAAGESNTGAQAQGNAEAINTQGQVAEPNADAPEATQPVMAAATTAGNAAGEPSTGAQAQGNAEAINTQGQVAEPNADAPEATQPVMAAATTAGNAAGESNTGAQAQGNAEAINTQGQVAEPNADAPEATQPVMAAATTAGNAAGESDAGAQSQSTEQPINTQGQVAEPNADAPEATQPVMAAATTAGNAAGEPSTGAQAQGNAEAINTQGQVAEPNADAPEATQPVMAAATTAGNAAGESDAGAQAQGNAEAINTQAQVAEPNADAPEATQPVMAAATTAGNAAGESDAGAQSQGNAEAINTQAQVAEPNADAPEATQPVMAAATTAGNAAGESDAGAQSQGNAEAINTQAQVAEPNADAPEATQPVMAAATTAGNAAGESNTGAQTQSPEQPLNTQAQADEMNMEGKIDIAAKEQSQNHVDEPKLSQLPEQSNLERMIFVPSQQVTSNENIKYNLNQNGQNDIEDNKEEVTRPNMPMLN